MTVPDQLCGCKGVRFCALCETTDRVKKLRVEEDKYADYEFYVYSQAEGKPVKAPELGSTSSIEEIIAGRLNFEFFPKFDLFSQ